MARTVLDTSLSTLKAAEHLWTRVKCQLVGPGVELNMAVNHLAPYLLTELLWELLEATAAEEQEHGARLGLGFGLGLG